MRRVIVIAFCIVLIAGCSKKQPQVQKPQQSLVETQAAIPGKNEPSKTQLTKLYPVIPEKQIKTPAWVKEIVSVYERDYNLWNEKSSTDTSSSILIASLTSIASYTPSSSGSPVSSMQPVISSSTEKPPSILRGTETSSVASTSTGISTVSLPSSGQFPVQPGTPESGGTTPQQPQEQPPQTSGVSVLRSIQNTADGAYIRLSVNVSDARVNGIIVTENLPDNYTFVNATPIVSKRTGNSIKWLFYGTSLTGQTINYEVKGSGRATISGSFSSTLGSGSTTGDSQVGR